MSRIRKRALSPSEVCRIKHKTFPLSRRWEEALGSPSTHGVWFVYGASGNGKSNFVMQLAKELCRHGKVIYDSLEEGFAKSFADSLIRNRMAEEETRLELYELLPLDRLKEILLQKRRPNIAIIDSIQETGFRSEHRYKAWLKGLEKKLIIFISQADPKGNPLGAVAQKAEFGAMIKIHVSGMRAECKSRFSSGEKDKDGKPVEKIGYYDIWEERASEVWDDGTCLLNNDNKDIDNGDDD